MTAIVTPLRIDRIQRALVNVLAEAVAPTEVHWGHTEPEQEQLSDGFVSLMFLSGPGPFIRSGKRGTTLTPIESVTLDVDSVTVGKRYGIELNGFNYFTDGASGDTVTTIRDRLVAAIEGDAGETATATAGAFSDELDLVADFLGGIRELAIYGALSASDLVRASDSVLVVEGSQVMVVNIQAFHKNREPRNGAQAVIQQCLAALQTEDLVETLRRFGVAVWGKSQPLDVSAIAGAHWETRVSCDVTFAARAAWVRPVDTIETVEGTISITDGDGTPVATSDFTASEP